MNCTFNDILDTEDILYIVVRYLDIDAKILLGKICKKNFLKFYNFNGSDFCDKDLNNIFEIDKNNIDGFMIHLKDYVIDYDVILDKYIEHNKRKYIENNLEKLYMYDDRLYTVKKEYQKRYKKNFLDIDHDITDDTNIYEPLFINKYIEQLCNIKNKNLIITMFACNTYLGYSKIATVFKKDLDNIILKSIYYKYVRTIIGIIEYYNIIQEILHQDIIEYDKEMDIFKLDYIYRNINYEIGKTLTEYYISVITDNIDTTIVCSRCGSFGHSNFSKKCLLYDKKFIKNTIASCINKIVVNVESNIYTYYANINRHRIKSLRLCNKCNNNNSLYCSNYNCIRCCTGIYSYHKAQRLKNLEKKERNIQWRSANNSL